MAINFTPNTRNAELLENERAEKEKFINEAALKVAVGAAFHPLFTVKTLFQLGHEPFPLSIGRAFGIGHRAYFLPNVFSYARNLAQVHGYAVLYCGVDAAIMSNIVAQTCFWNTNRYIDRFYPDLGGKPINLEKKEKELTDYESAQRALREAVRKSVVQCVGVIVARPFTVIAIRKVAQIVGGETKYTNVLSSLYLIGKEEGPKGLFAGIIPQILTELITVWGAAVLYYGLERAVTRLKLENEGDQASEEALESARKAVSLTVPFIVNTFAYSYSVVSVVMAVSGSGLAVSMLPYSPSFNTWYDAWNYLEPIQGLKRGARMFFREHVGAVSIGMDHNVYADNKHFI
ncbi:hypothetical protein AB6A40_003617 [Gnathostoma spinigerum]|uniref:Mitochondrial carrier-like protein 2 n=1 Tax=Gnathostoma spinigerum TaxID=75299 RepID=A0ABD6EA85_9BILA